MDKRQERIGTIRGVVALSKRAQQLVQARKLRGTVIRKVGEVRKEKMHELLLRENIEM
ncbi:MAG: hypothetical protein LBD61_05085 [Endomicrobium sp.]|jgi:hypothetical protein|nr:hypothetical protein [Endomicrobium sp.]